MTNNQPREHWKSKWQRSTSNHLESYITTKRDTRVDYRIHVFLCPIYSRTNPFSFSSITFITLGQSNQITCSMHFVFSTHRVHTNCQKLIHLNACWNRGLVTNYIVLEVTFIDLSGIQNQSGKPYSSVRLVANLSERIEWYWTSESRVRFREHTVFATSYIIT